MNDKMKEKIPVTHMELVRDEVRNRIFDKPIKKYSHLRGTYNLHEYYRYISVKALGLEFNDDNIITNESIEKAFGVLSKDDAFNIVHTFELELILYDFFWKQKKIFRFRDSLVNKLQLTHLKKVDSFFLKLPFEGIVITTSNNAAIKIETNGRVLSVNEMYISLEETNETKRFSIQAFENIGKYEMNTTNSYTFSVNINKGDILSQIEKINIPAITELTHFVMSALLYLNSSQPDINPLPITKSPIEKILRKNGEGNSSIPQYSVGNHITIDRTWDKTQNPNNTSKRQYNLITPKWLVRGHWRQQRYGENRQEIKLIWIEPFVKGHDLSKEFVEKTYDVKIRD
jgi:hypothetical protein